jgi:hypothetical protein
MVQTSTINMVMFERQEDAMPGSVSPVESVPVEPTVPTFFDLLGPKVVVSRAAL